MNLLRTVASLLLAGGLLLSQAVSAGLDPKNPKYLENFRLTTQNGESWSLAHQGDAAAVVLYVYGVGCPIVRQSIPELNRIQEEFGPKNVIFAMISANAQDTREDIRKDAAEFGVTAPILVDESQEIVRSWGTERTAEVLVLDPKDKFRVLYQGPVDDRFDYGAQRETAEHAWLRDALTAHLAGQPVTNTGGQTKGCLINYLAPAEVSYSKDIAPILEAKCVSCHVGGGIAPFAMSSYKKVKGWSGMIGETIKTRRMPPWHPDRTVGKFLHDRALSPEQEALVLRWVAQGAPRGEGDDPLELRAAAPLAKWDLGEPDLVVELPEEQQIAATGTADYRYLFVPSGLTEDKWVKAVQVAPSNTAVLHHALIFVMYPPEYEHIQPDPKSGLNGFFASFLPGAPVVPYPAEAGQFLPAGSSFVFQMHYNATGKAETDRTQMGLYFYDEKPKRALMIRAAAETEFAIPPNTAKMDAEAGYRFKREVTLVGMAPHMHYRGSHFKFAAKFPEGQEIPILNIPFYEFDWQPMYFLEEPMTLPAGTEIHCDGGFDNSRFNPRNPDPSDWVYFGEQSWEEMFIGYLAYAVDRDDAYFTPQKREVIGDGLPMSAEKLPGTEWRIMQRITIRFEPEGKLIVNNEMEGTWRVDGKTVHLDTDFRDVDLIMEGPELIIEGRRLERLK
ncbi:MAG: redoxin family protein [Candidatus Hydrogenedentes bacterium]|nr:redoxin family protein [Candidatus Hydrogenedentota bacterium]